MRLKTLLPLLIKTRICFDKKKTGAQSLIPDKAIK